MRSLCLTVLLCAICSLTRAAELVSDVVIYGATPAGVCAAIAASREGASVTLLEPSNHIGGIATSGLSWSNSHQTLRSTTMDLFHEWHSRIEGDYAARNIKLPYQVSVKDSSPWTYEPHVAMRVTRQMLDEVRVLILPARQLTSVSLENNRLTKLHTTEGSFRATVFIDATYEGDLMAMAGVSWTIGRESRAEFDESYAGPDQEGDSHVMAYNFRLCLTKAPENRVPFPPPAHYDPARFEVVRRWLLQEKNPPPLWDLHPLPGDKFDAQIGIGKPFTLDLVGVSKGWSEADPASRATLWEAHRQYTLELYHFLTTDPAVPEKHRQELASLGLAKDEFSDNAHWPPQLHVREGRRMKGLHILSQKDLLDEPAKDVAIAIATFPTASQVIPYHISYQNLLPLPEECENLIVPVSLSSTHVAYSSIRLEPTWMSLGQSAGIAAALVSKDDSSPSVQSLDYLALRARLLAQGQILDLPKIPAETEPSATIDPTTLPGLVLDDSSAKMEGPWITSSTFKPHLAKGYHHDDQRGDGLCIATFIFQIEKTATYALRFAYSAHEARATNIPITIEANGKKAALLLDQTVSLPPGELFRTLADLDLQSGQTVTITLTNKNTDGYVIVDGVSLVESTTPDE